MSMRNRGEPDLSQARFDLRYAAESGAKARSEMRHDRARSSLQQ